MAESVLDTTIDRSSGHHNNRRDGSERFPDGRPPELDRYTKYDPGRTSKAQQSIKLRQLLIEEGVSPTGIYDEKTGLPIARIQQVVRRIYDAAEAGEAWAANLIFDRIGGKAPTAIGADDNGPTVMLVIRGASTDDL